MSNFMPGNYDLRIALIFCYWRKLLQNRIECLSKFTVSMLLVNHSALSGLKNSKWRFWREKQRTWKTTEKIWRQWIASIVGWGWRSNSTTTRGSIECNTRSRLHTLKSMGKIQKENGFHMNWMTAGKSKNHLRNAARQVQKKIISPSNCDWRKVNIFWES